MMHFPEALASASLPGSPVPWPFSSPRWLLLCIAPCDMGARFLPLSACAACTRLRSFVFFGFALGAIIHFDTGAVPQRAQDLVAAGDDLVTLFQSATTSMSVVPAIPVVDWLRSRHLLVLRITKRPGFFLRIRLLRELAAWTALCPCSSRIESPRSRTVSA